MGFLLCLSQSIALLVGLNQEQTQWGNQQKCQASIKCMCVYSNHVTSSALWEYYEASLFGTPSQKPI